MLLWQLLGSEGGRKRETRERLNQGLFGMAGSGNVAGMVLGKVWQRHPKETLLY